MSGNTVAIICEYNPFHYGHKHQIDELRRNGAERIIGIMSGNFTQRGEAAIIPKHERALGAVRCGLDLVLELPFPFSCAYAEAFAGAGVRIAEAVGARYLNFGSECGSVERLSALADASLSDDFINGTDEDDGKHKNTSYFKRLESVTEGFKFSSNDILGFQYVREIKRQGLALTPTTKKREGADYNSLSTDVGAGPVSARAIREALFKGADVSALLPTETAKILSECVSRGLAPIRLSDISDAVVLYFRLTPQSNHTDVADMPEGFAERLRAVALKVTSVDEMVSELTNPSFSASRVRRLMLFCLCGVRKSDLIPENIDCVNLLAANECGRRYAAQLRREGVDLIFSKPADMQRVSANARRLYELSHLADSLYTLMMRDKKGSGDFIRRSPYMV